MSSLTLDPNRFATDLSHMPFLSKNGNQLDLVFAWSTVSYPRVPVYSPSGVTRAWKLARGTFNTGTQAVTSLDLLDTGLECNELACSPCVSRSNGNVSLSFIGTARHGTGTLEHHLFLMSGPSLDRLGRAARVSNGRCYCGFWRSDLIATATGLDGQFQLQGQVQGNYSTSFKQLDRLSFDPDQPWHLLITGSLIENQLSRTIVYDAKQDVVLGELQLSGAPTYKPALSGGLLAYPTPVDRPIREGWRLAFATSYGLIPTHVTVTRQM